MFLEMAFRVRKYRKIKENMTAAVQSAFLCLFGYLI